MTNATPKTNASSGRRLSPWRVLLAIFLVAGISAGSWFGTRQWQAAQAQASHEPWFAPYVDVTSTPTFAFEQMGETKHHDVILSFVVSSPSSACTPSWGGAYTLDEASGAVDLDRRIARLKQQKGSVAVSFGGLKNNELAVGCKNANDLKAAYKAVVDRYEIDTIDLDLENNGLTNTEAGTRRAAAIATLQKERRTQGKSLAVWVTLPVTPQGLSQDGTNAISTLLSKGVDLAGVNIMTMDYGQSRGDMGMLKASEKAASQTHRQLGVLYDQAGIHLNNATLWSKLGVTPMLGQNDETKEIFTLADAQGFNKFARSHNIARMSMWSANRDVPCGSNYVNVKIVSDSCSGVSERKHSFANALGAGFKGSLARSAGLVTTEDAQTTQQKDDPANSPYQIWSEAGAYLQGTKVVWHRNVYQAKWWNQGSSPAAASSNPDNSPWVPLTQAQINAVLKEQKQ